MKITYGLLFLDGWGVVRSGSWNLVLEKGEPSCNPVHAQSLF